jgi:hypothetical protein
LSRINAGTFGRKQAQFELRARPTEELVAIARGSTSPVYVKCFPYDPELAMLALQIHQGDSAPRIVFVKDSAEREEAVDLCSGFR